MADQSDPLVKIEHLRSANLCVHGARTWFATHGLSFREFLQHGIPASRIEATGDALGIKVATCAREQARSR